MKKSVPLQLKVLMHSPEKCQLKTVDSIEDAMEAIYEYEESTTTNFNVLETKKDFGNEAFMPTSKVTVHWEGPVVNDVSLHEFSGVPFIIVGRKVLGCHHGRDRAVAQKRKYAEAILQKENDLMQSAQKIHCPAKIYLYHILKFPEFQITQQTRRQMSAASKKIRDSLAQNSQLNHSYIILFPQLLLHEDHPPDGEALLLPQDTYQLKTLDSLEMAMLIISEFKESTAANYIVLETHKDFGNEEFRPTSKFPVHWEGPVINNVSLYEYSGVPFILVGRKVLGCHFETDHSATQEARSAEFTSQMEVDDITDCSLVERRMIMRTTKKRNCPAKIYMYHIMKFPDFQIKKKTSWLTSEAAKKIKGSLETNIRSIHSYKILFPHISHHMNHPVDRKVSPAKKKIHSRIVQKITEFPVLMPPSPEICQTLHSGQLKTLDSFENAMEAINEFEESTTSNFNAIEKHKDFGKEAFRPTSKVTVHWEGPMVNNVSLHEFSGVPFIIIGRKVLGCHHGRDRAIAQKRRHAEAIRQKEITDCPLVKRRSLMQTKKKNCPAKIYIYHIMKFPDFQIEKKTSWRRGEAAKKIKSSLETNIRSIHSYTILFPHISHHMNHPVDGNVAHAKEKIDPRIVKKITELFESGVRNRRDIKTLLDHFVRVELFVEQDLPINSRRRFFPSLKDIDNIKNRSTNKQKSLVVDQSTDVC
ncbi:uncharacterized protein LOC142256862 isoform X2 [Anomaloglossus baeobatrachus]|uniref:uncharacterized protein LOC142256862 isoform X2 n=1 Tax=Anomaloglossus baeobatrachus TaxID=238106 RepID=UPI003F4FBA9A